jgi:hypothetical protein
MEALSEISLQMLNGWGEHERELCVNVTVFIFSPFAESLLLLLVSRNKLLLSKFHLRNLMFYGSSLLHTST